jgi:hypothetical protein
MLSSFFCFHICEKGSEKHLIVRNKFLAMLLLRGNRFLINVKTNLLATGKMVISGPP